MVDELNDLNVWEIIENGLPKDFNIEATYGGRAIEIYVVGFKGELWRYNGDE